MVLPQFDTWKAIRKVSPTRLKARHPGANTRTPLQHCNVVTATARQFANPSDGENFHTVAPPPKSSLPDNPLDQPWNASAEVGVRGTAGPPQCGKRCGSLRQGGCAAATAPPSAGSPPRWWAPASGRTCGWPCPGQGKQQTATNQKQKSHLKRSVGQHSGSHRG